jgi:YHS domain-containing protein
MKIILSIAILLLLAGQLVHSQTHAGKKNFNLTEAGVAIQGYDPVSYFVSNRSIEGRKELSLSYDGVVYYFSSPTNRDTFKANPAKYTPEYGGWCAFAMGDSGDLVEVDPETFKIIDGKLYLFYNKLFNNTLNSWNKDEAGLKNRANKNWLKYQ